MFERVPTAPHLAWQPGLGFDDDPAGAAADAVTLDRTFSARVRHRLDARSWVDLVPGWLQGADALFERLLREAAWTAREVPMYDRILPEPRLSAFFPAELPAPLCAIRDALRVEYATPFDSVAVNLYRDGRDSVAWHGDRVGRRLSEPLVATVTLGAARRFLLRPRAGGPAFALRPGPGDLVMMGGACQREWLHCVPKTARAIGARMAVTVRHGADPATGRPYGASPAGVSAPGP